MVGRDRFSDDVRFRFAFLVYWSGLPLGRRGFREGGWGACRKGSSRRRRDRSRREGRLSCRRGGVTKLTCRPEGAGCVQARG